MPHDQEGNAHGCVDGLIDYKAIVSVINEGVIILQDGEIVFVNPAFAHLVGKDVSEVTGSSLYAVGFLELQPNSEPMH